MANSFKDATQLFDRFKAAYQKKDLKTCQSLLPQLKLKLTEFRSLPPAFEPSPTSQQELLLAREVFEYAVFLSVQLQDEAAFERNYLQLKPFYTDVRESLKAHPSSKEDVITGLNLLRLLVQNRIAEFHTELELIHPQAMHTAPIETAVQLEQWLMEGAYNKVLGSRVGMPAEFGYFLDQLSTTVRDEIAGCSERAYEHLNMDDGKKLIMFRSDNEVLQYAQQRGWDVKNGRITFQPVAEEQGDIPAVELISHSLTYARELERIV